MSETQFPPVFDRQQVLESYLEAMVWQGTLSYMTGTAEFGGEPMSDAGLDRLVEPDELPEEILAAARDDVAEFLDAIEAGLEDYPRSNELTAKQLGRDFCLTRNHHGAGFWDRGLGHLGDYLTTAAQSMGSADVQGSIILKNPKLADPELLAWENLDHDTLKVWAA